MKVTERDACRCITEIANEYRSMTYSELVELANRQERGELSSERREDLANGEVLIGIALQKFGLLRKRVSVEIVAAADNDDEWKTTPCVYFERFASGRFHERKLSPFEYVFFNLFALISPLIFIALILYLIVRIM